MRDDAHARKIRRQIVAVIEKRGLGGIAGIQELAFADRCRILGKLHRRCLHPVDRGQGILGGRQGETVAVELAQGVAYRRDRRLGLLGVSGIDRTRDQGAEQAATGRHGDVRRVDVGLDFGLADHDFDRAAAVEGVAAFGNDHGRHTGIGSRHGQQADATQQNTGTEKGLHIIPPGNCFAM